MLIEKNTLLKLIFIIFLLFVCIYGINYQTENKSYFKMCAYIILAINIFMTIRNRKNVMLFFSYLIISYFNFSALYDLYIEQAPALSVFYGMFSNDVVLGKGIYMMMLFTTILLVFDVFCSKKISKIEKDTFIKEENKNLILAWTLLILAMFSSYIWWQLLEYSGAIIIISIFFCGNNKVYKGFCTLYLIYIFYTLNVLGMRVPGLCFPIIGLFMLYGYLINYKHIFIGIVIAIILMTYSGLYTDTGGQATIGDTIDKLQQSGGALDTCQFSYMSSQTGIKVADDILSKEEIRDYFGRFVKSQVVLSSRSIEFCKMCLITREYYTHFNGQFMPHTFYFYLGWFGVIFSGLLTGAYLLIIRILDLKSNNLVIIYSIWVVSMIAKWYLYEPNALIKGSLFLLIVFLLTRFIDKVMKKALV